jgi:hypothetical protein
MIQEYIEKNRDTIARWAKRMMIVGWVLLITVLVTLSLSVIQLSWASGMAIWSSISFVVLRIISPAFFGLLFLLLGQFLQYELGLEKKAGWFLRNGVIILRVYAAVIVGYIILLLPASIFSIQSMSKQSLLLAGHYLFSFVLSVPKVLLLWGAASMLKMMMSGMRENTQLNV